MYIMMHTVLFKIIATAIIKTIIMMIMLQLVNISIINEDMRQAQCKNAVLRSAKWTQRLLDGAATATAAAAATMSTAIRCSNANVACLSSILIQFVSD